MILTDLHEQAIRAAFAAGQRRFGGFHVADEEAAIEAVLRELDALDAAATGRRVRDLIEGGQRSESTLPADLHRRLAAAIRDEPVTALPTGIHARLAAAVLGERLLIEADARRGDGASVREGPLNPPDIAPLPDGVHARLAAAVTGRPYVAVPGSAHTKELFETPDAGPALPEGIHERLANAILDRIP